MKNIIKLFILFTFFSIGSTGSLGADYDDKFATDYMMENITAFINSPDGGDLDTISKDNNLQFCESVYLQAYMRRDFTDSELSICGLFFEMKFEQEMSYKNYMYNNRGLFH